MALTEECQTTRPLDNSPQTTRPRSSDSIVDKRTKNNLYDVLGFTFLAARLARWWIKERGGLGRLKIGTSCLWQIVQGASCLDTLQRGGH